jgi:hypothetical protein
MKFIQVKSLAGFSYVRADQVVAVYSTEPSKCSLALGSGVTVACAESAKDVVERVEAAARAEPEPE